MTLLQVGHCSNRKKFELQGYMQLREKKNLIRKIEQLILTCSCTIGVAIIINKKRAGCNVFQKKEEKKKFDKFHFYSTKIKPKQIS